MTEWLNRTELNVTKIIILYKVAYILLLHKYRREVISDAFLIFSCKQFPRCPQSFHVRLSSRGLRAKTGELFFEDYNSYGVYLQGCAKAIFWMFAKLSTLILIGPLLHSFWVWNQHSGIRTNGKVTFALKVLVENLPAGKVVGTETLTEHKHTHTHTRTHTHTHTHTPLLSSSFPNTAQREPLINQCFRAKFLKGLRKSFDPACCDSVWMVWIESMVSGPQIMPSHKCLVA